MVKLTKIYTRGGDKGETSLGDGKRTAKHSLRVIAYGEVDELNSALGLIACYAQPGEKKKILKIQNDLFDLGADLCVPSGPGLRATKEQVKWLEDEIDAMNAHLAPLNSFILPGGSFPASFTHLARAIARRAERAITLLATEEEVNPEVIKYINRLSDYLFVLARHLNAKEAGDITWVPGGQREL